VHYIKERVLAGEVLAGVWCNLASSITTEIAALAGFDWLLIDQEHGPGDNETLLRQLQAVGERPCAPIVRIVWNEMPRFKRALDLGAMGIMVPYIQTVEEAQRAVSYMRYPPEGLRGAAISPRATGYGARFEAYFTEANRNLLLVNQIETARAVENIQEIARVKGIDILFVGPLDLSLSLEMPKRFEDPEFRVVIAKVAHAAREAGKAAGILLPSVQLVEMVHDMGFTFVAVGSDGSMVVEGMKNSLAALPHFKK